MAQSVSLSADSDKGSSPLTSAAFLTKLLHQKTFMSGIAFLVTFTFFATYKKENSTRRSLFQKIQFVS
jgi:hypothetical protein